ncbi:MAG TPA: IPT/TIG domain-containing protein [Solirubrobacterales bacterium]|nr:IPT/TIG domain-containing protein [Solirubrobacterales bacterium]
MIAFLAFATSSQAATVTVGARLPMDVVENVVIGCSESCVVTNPTAPDGASDLSPVDGVILRWRLYRGSAPSPEGPDPGYRLRVLTPFAGGYLAAGTSSLAVPTRFDAVETFSTYLPVRAGQLIALEALNHDSSLRFGFSKAATSVFLEPAIADGEDAPEQPVWEDGYLFPFNADVLPPPRIYGVSPSGGSVGSSANVIVRGDNFAEVGSVIFGGQPVEFTVDSESQITAKAPPGTQIGPVAVTVTTIAGRAEAAGGYRYDGCVVPKLKGKSLKAARNALRLSKCRLGDVRRRHGATARTGRVKRQGLPRGAVLPPDAPVEVALGLNPKRLP